MTTIAVMGAGAVGCYYGGMLARAGHRVTLIGRSTHVEAIRRRGLRLQTQSFDDVVLVDASTDADAVADAQLILVCVKSGDSESAAAQMQPHLADGALLLSLQNGVDNAERIERQLANPVWPAVVYVATEMAGAGHVRHHGRGELVLGRGTTGAPSATPALDEAAVVALFSSAGIPMTVSDNVIGALWGKLVLNCAYNALSAIAQMPYGELVQSDGVNAVIRSVVDECLAVAQASKITIPGDVDEAVVRIGQTMAAQYSSTAQDLARGRPTEIDHLNGYVVRQGEVLGVPTPVNRALQVLVKLLSVRGAVAAPIGPR